MTIGGTTGPQTDEGGPPADEGGRAGPPAASYLVCSLPRSGGKLLAAGLRETGVVAVPEPRLWWGWRGHDPRLRRLLQQGPEALAASPGALEHLVASGTTATGEFGAEVQWRELSRLLSALRRTRGAPAATDHELLAALLPGVRYVHLTREDKTAQAIDWWWAKHARAGRPDEGGDGADGAPVVHDRAPFDPAAVEQLERRLLADEWRWVAFFARAGVEPLVVSYEALRADGSGTLRRVLGFLGVDREPVMTPRLRVVAPTESTERWYREYHQWRRHRRAAGEMGSREVTIVVSGHAAGDDLDRDVDRLARTVHGPFETVVVDDRPSGAGGPGVSAPRGPAGPPCPHPGGAPGPVRVVVPPPASSRAAARNFGAAHGRGETLVFVDAHAELHDGWLEPLQAALREPTVGVTGPVIAAAPGAVRPLGWPAPRSRPSEDPDQPASPVPSPFVPSYCMAFRRRDFEAAGGFDIGMVVAGSEDAEICLHLWRRGRLCLAVPGSWVDPPPALVDGGGASTEACLYNELRLAAIHFGPETLLRTFDTAAASPDFPEAYGRLLGSDVFERRRRVVAAAAHDDQWFVDGFGLEVLR